MIFLIVFFFVLAFKIKIYFRKTNTPDNFWEISVHSIYDCYNFVFAALLARSSYFFVLCLKRSCDVITGSVSLTQNIFANNNIGGE